MYVKLFTSIYQGTLRGNSRGLLVFTNLLAHADQDGIVDITANVISDEVGLSLEEVKKTLVELESPDPESRSSVNEGRRIIRVSNHRSWGWEIVNFKKYDSIRSRADRREQNRIAQEKWRNSKQDVSNSKQDVSNGKPKSAESAHTDTDTDTDTNTNTDTNSTPFVDSDADRPEKELKKVQGESFPDLSKLPVDSLGDCPHQEIISLYEKHLPTLTQPRVWDGKRTEALRSRWRYCAKVNGVSRGYKTREEGIAFWDRYFRFVASETSLPNGYERPGGKTWFPDLEWLVKAENFIKVVEGKYAK